MCIWLYPYLGAPVNIWVHKSKQFMFGIFGILCRSFGANIIPIAVEAHWLWSNDTMALRRFVRKLREDCSGVPLDVLADYANTVMSHTMGPEGFSSAILDFEEDPIIASPSDRHTAHVSCCYRLSRVRERGCQNSCSQGHDFFYSQRELAPCQPRGKSTRFFARVRVDGPYKFKSNAG